MLVGKTEYRTIWMENGVVMMIDQNLLPFTFKIVKSSTFEETANHIRIMTVRGAGAIGAAAGFAMAQACLQAPNDGYERYIFKARKLIEETRPTARNLFYAIERVFAAGVNNKENALIAAQAIANQDAADSQAIGIFGNEIIKSGFNIATHCNAGWLAFVDFGTALSPIYVAHRSGKKIHVFVDETRPRLQGARLTAWELQKEGVPHTIIPDNATAFLMYQKKIDLMIVGADRIAINGDVANKIGTLEKAICAKAFNIPFYVAAPSSTFDSKCKSGDEIKIEYRDEDEVLWQSGITKNGEIETILLSNPLSPALNPSFDITPAEYITGIITEKGIIEPNRNAIAKLILNR